MNIVDRFIYKYSEQLKLTMKAMMNGKLSDAETKLLEELKSEDVELAAGYIYPNNLEPGEFNQRILDLLKENIGATLIAQIGFYNKFNATVLEFKDEDKNKLHSAINRFYLKGFNLFYPVSPLLISRSALILPEYLEEEDAISKYASFIESIERVSKTDVLLSAISSILFTPSITGVMTMYETYLTEDVLRVLSESYTVEILRNIRDSATALATINDGEVFSHISYQMLLILKLIDELIYTLEP